MAVAPCERDERKRGSRPVAQNGISLPCSILGTPHLPERKWEGGRGSTARPMRHSLAVPRIQPGCPGVGDVTMETATDWIWPHQSRIPSNYPGGPDGRHGR